MTISNLEQLWIEIERLAKSINLPNDMYPKFVMPPEPTFDYDTYIILEGKYYLVFCSELMGVFSRIKTYSLAELLYCVFESLTSGLAESLSLKVYIPNVEVRRYIWSKQLKLMHQLSPNWSYRLAVKISDTLAKHPPRDGLGDTANKLNFTNTLRTNKGSFRL